MSRFSHARRSRGHLLSAGFFLSSEMTADTSFAVMDSSTSRRGYGVGGTGSVEWSEAGGPGGTGGTGGSGRLER